MNLKFHVNVTNFKTLFIYHEINNHTLLFFFISITDFSTEKYFLKLNGLNDIFKIKHLK